MQLNTTYDLGQVVYIMPLNRIQPALVSKIEITALTVAREKSTKVVLVERYHVQSLAREDRGTTHSCSVDTVFATPEALTAKLLKDVEGVVPPKGAVTPLSPDTFRGSHGLQPPGWERGIYWAVPEP
jgi:hypothetical protein